MSLEQCVRNPKATLQTIELSYVVYASLRFTMLYLIICLILPIFYRR